ncbi:MAG: phospholipase D-like domain-containing protein [Gammaproteobacteria bacterium]|jgi:cardiolipin synthase
MSPVELDNTPFPWRDGNRFRLLMDGDQFFPAMLGAVAAAESYVLLEMYLMESGTVTDRFIAALCAAADRGVAVSILLDDFGCLRLQRVDRERLQRANISVRYYNRLRYGKLQRNFARDHRKLLLVDGRVAFVGGAGITDEFDPPLHPERRWRETMVVIEGPVVADWHALFRRNWNQMADGDLAPPRVSDLAMGNQRGRVNFSRGILHADIKRTAISRIRHAHYRVWLATAYFVPSMKLRRALRRAVRRGVDVRLLLPGDHTDHPAVRHAGRRFYRRLLHHGVRIFEFQPRFTHSKVLLCDHWASVGSSNLDRWTLRWNLEANQEVDDEAFSDQVQGMLKQDFGHSRERLYSEWTRRPWYRSWKEDFWGWVDIWMERLFRQPPPRRPHE